MAFDLDDALAVLKTTPPTLSTLLSGLSSTWVLATEGEGTWSPFDVLGHLIHGERTDWMPRARHILAGDARPFEPFDRTAMFAESRGKGLNELLKTFAQLRAENLVELRALKLSREKLERTGEHPELGVVTLRQLLATWVVHDLDHVGQIARVMAKAYADEVGPWRAYVSILNDRRQ
ncbi:MAG TPA: DinB family protein [Thermoanaerobaculia bacterium]|nr:DinB family protein [Thermoanaerobaculia bacterium]